LRRTTRTGTNYPLTASSLVNLDATAITDNLKNRGTAYASDLGVNLSLPGPVSPTLSLVWRNMGVTKFSHERGLKAPPSDRDEMSLGAGITIDALLVKIRPAIDYRHINWANEQFGKKLHLGVEVSLPIIDVRVGLNQGYYTLGAGVDLGFIRVDAATYGVELGEYPGQLQDRRYALQFTLEMGFNPGTGFLGGGGSQTGGSAGRRGLKQRR
jgi:hypothetical protein